MTRSYSPAGKSKAFELMTYESAFPRLGIPLLSQLGSSRRERLIQLPLPESNQGSNPGAVSLGWLPVSLAAAGYRSPRPAMAGCLLVGRAGLDEIGILGQPGGEVCS